MSVSIDPQEMYVWLACEDGYHKFAGHIIEIDGIKFSIVMYPKENRGFEMRFSDLVSGAKFFAVPLATFEMLMCDSKEKTYAMFEKASQIVSDAILRIGKERIISMSKEQAEKNKSKFGEMPEMEICNFPQEEVE